MPVDAHELIALCAPRPVFIGSGSQTAGDSWVDPKGMFMAAVAAGPVYRVLTWLNLAGGIAIAGVGLFVAEQMQLIIVGFSLIGISSFVRMRRFAAQPPAEARWWMRQHLNAMLGNGVATHIAFLSIGLPRLLPVLQGPLFQNIAWLAPLGVSALAGLYLGRKYLPAPNPRAVNAVPAR